MVEQIGEKLIADHPFDVPVSLINLSNSGWLSRVLNG